MAHRDRSTIVQINSEEIMKNYDTWRKIDEREDEVRKRERIAQDKLSKIIVAIVLVNFILSIVSVFAFSFASDHGLMTANTAINFFANVGFVALLIFVSCLIYTKILSTKLEQELSEALSEFEELRKEWNVHLRQVCSDTLYKWYGAEFVNIEQLLGPRFDRYVEIRLDDGSILGVDRFMFNKADEMTIYVTPAHEKHENAPLKPKSKPKETANKPVDVIASLKEETGE